MRRRPVAPRELCHVRIPSALRVAIVPLPERRENRRIEGADLAIDAFVRRHRRRALVGCAVAILAADGEDEGCGAQRLRLRLHHALGVRLDLPRRVRPKRCDPLIVRAVDVALHAPRVIVEPVPRHLRVVVRRVPRVAEDVWRRLERGHRLVHHRRVLRLVAREIRPGVARELGHPERLAAGEAVPPLELVQQPRAPVAPFDARPVVDVAVAGRRLEVEVVAAEVELAAGGAVERGAVALPLLPPPRLRGARRDDLEAVVRRDRLDVRPQLRRVRSVDVRLVRKLGLVEREQVARRLEAGDDGGVARRDKVEQRLRAPHHRHELLAGGARAGDGGGARRRRSWPRSWASLPMSTTMMTTSGGRGRRTSAACAQRRLACCPPRRSRSRRHTQPQSA